MHARVDGFQCRYAKCCRQPAGSDCRSTGTLAQIIACLRYDVCFTGEDEMTADLE